MYLRKATNYVQSESRNTQPLLYLCWIRPGYWLKWTRVACLLNKTVFDHFIKYVTENMYWSRFSNEKRLQLVLLLYDNGIITIIYLFSGKSFFWPVIQKQHIICSNGIQIKPYFSLITYPYSIKVPEVFGPEIKFETRKKCCSYTACS